MACLAVVSAVLVWAGGVNRAIAVDYPVFTFDSGSADTPPAGWLMNPWGSPNNQGEYSVWASTPDATGNGGGSLQIVDDWGAGSSFFIDGWFSGNTYDSGATTNLLLFTNITFQVQWDNVDSTISIDQFNDNEGAGGDQGVQLWAIPTDNGNANDWITLGSFNIPDSASTGWQTINVPVNKAIPGISTIRGLGFKKYTGSGLTGWAYFYVDNITLQGTGTLPAGPTLSLVTSSPQGLNIYDDLNAYDRQSIATVVTNAGPDYDYSFADSTTPTTYSFTVAQFPATNYANYWIYIFIMPGDNIPITETSPDYNEANVIAFSIESLADSTNVLGTLNYKVDEPSGNTYMYQNPAVAGEGGRVGTVTNANGAIGTWRMTIDNEGNITLQSPDGHHSTMALAAGDVSDFTGPVTVYWGTQPNTAGWGQDVVLNNVSITGDSINTLNVNLTQPLNPAQMVAAASSPSLLFTTPTNAAYWLQWTLPDVGYALQGASSLTGPWTSIVGAPVITGVFTNTFDSSASFDNGRNYNPPPMGVAYDYGNATANSVAWASGPTYDAGGSPTSGSLELNWTWNYTANGAGSADFTMDLFPSAIDCSGGTLSFDIMVDPSSTAGGYSDYGYFQVFTRDESYNTTGTSLGEGLITAAGGTTGGWGHVSIVLGADTLVRGLTFQDYNDSGRAINGSETIYIDNLKLTQSTATGPTTYTVNGKHSVFITTPMLPSSGTGFFQLVNPME